jgi:hypothetical protein
MRIAIFCVHTSSTHSSRVDVASQLIGPPMKRNSNFAGSRPKARRTTLRKFAAFDQMMNGGDLLTSNIREQVGGYQRSDAVACRTIFTDSTYSHVGRDRDKELVQSTKTRKLVAFSGRDVIKMPPDPNDVETGRQWRIMFDTPFENTQKMAGMLPVLRFVSASPLNNISAGCSTIISHPGLPLSRRFVERYSRPQAR